jgi:protein-tyrosine phosphatase
LLDAGVREFIDLPEEHEPAPPYTAALRERAEARGIRARHRRFAIPDWGVPSDALMRSILNSIHVALQAGDPVYLHCFAGVGRTGTVVGCLLRESGLSADEALAIIAAKWRAMEKCQRHKKSPESPAQFALIARWCPG